MLGTRRERQSCSSGQCRAPSLAQSFICAAKSSSARSHPVGGCSRSRTSPHVGGSLAQAICRGDPARSDPQERCSSSSPTTCGAFALPLELVRPTRTQCVVGTGPTTHHGGWRSCIPRQQLIKEESANTTAFSMRYSLPSELIMRAERPCLLSASSSNHPLSLYCSFA
jgi:hypothetical protein